MEAAAEEISNFITDVVLVHMLSTTHLNLLLETFKQTLTQESRSKNHTIMVPLISVLGRKLAEDNKEHTLTVRNRRKFVGKLVALFFEIILSQPGNFAVIRGVLNHVEQWIIDASEASQLVQQGQPDFLLQVLVNISKVTFSEKYKLRIFSLFHSAVVHLVDMSALTQASVKFLLNVIPRSQTSAYATSQLTRSTPCSKIVIFILSEIMKDPSSLNFVDAFLGEATDSLLKRKIKESGLFDEHSIVSRWSAVDRSSNRTGGSSNSKKSCPTAPKGNKSAPAGSSKKSHAPSRLKRQERRRLARKHMMHRQAAAALADVTNKNKPHVMDEQEKLQQEQQEISLDVEDLLTQEGLRKADRKELYSGDTTKVLAAARSMRTEEQLAGIISRLDAQAEQFRDMEQRKMTEKAMMREEIKEEMATKTSITMEEVRARFSTTTAPATPAAPNRIGSTSSNTSSTITPIVLLTPAQPAQIQQENNNTLSFSPAILCRYPKSSLLSPLTSPLYLHT